MSARISFPGHTRLRHPPSLVAASWAAVGPGVHTFVLMVALGSRDGDATRFRVLWTPAAVAAAFLAAGQRAGRTTAHRPAAG
ncbi:hypothetical protein ACF065_18440 [Streptomyces sp. NPDC015232]|uniref:hypothetical protein n=1 Tax=unclassified Streptomyces TaxID=2593676 RepID=UPI0036FE4C47